MICNNLGSGQWHREVSSHTECHSSRKRIQEHPLFNNFFMSVSTSPRGARGQTPPLTSGFHCAGQKRNTGDTEQTGIIRDQRPETDPGNFRGVIQCWNSCGTAAPLQTTASWWKHTNKTLTQNVETRVLKVCHSAHLPKWTYGNQGFIISQAVWLQALPNLRNPSLFRRRREIFQSPRSSVNGSPQLNKGGNPDMGACYMGRNDSHNASSAEKKRRKKQKIHKFPDFLQWMLPAVNLFPYKHNFEWCCDLLAQKSSKWCS